MVLSPTTRPEPMFELIQRHKVTHIKVVPALLIRMINDPAIGKYDLSSVRIIQSGGQRMQPEVRLRTQQLIGYESGADRVVDPLAGSYYVEYLTDEMEKRALAYIQRIDEMGGIIRAVEEQYPPRG